MLKALVITTALAVVTYSLWIRRFTWTYRWEKCTTCSVALLGVSGVLTSPLFDSTVGRYIWKTTGLRDAENVLGHALLIFASVGIVHTVTSRYVYENEQADLLRKWIHLPAFFAAGALLVPAVCAGLDTPVLSGGPWIAAYWIIQSAIVAYLLGFAAVILNRLREEPRHKQTADLYLAACVVGILACLARIAPLVLTNIDFPGPQSIQILASTLKYAWIGLFAYAAADSWKRKTRHFQPAQPALV